MRRTTPLIALAGALLCGCASNNIRATMDGGQSYKAWTDEELNARGRCDLRVCILDDADAGGFHRMLQNVYTDRFSKVVASVQFTQNMAGGRNCDIGMRFASMANGDASDVISAFDGSLLARIDANFERASKIVCALFDPATELGARIAAGRATLGIFTAPRVAAAPPAAPAYAPPPPVPARPAGPLLPPPVAPDFSAPERADDLAVIVGVEDYPDLPKAKFAERDAAAFKAHVRALGVPERNIAYLSGARATKSALEKNVETWLVRLAKPDSRVYFYFSGHGAPDASSGEAYLVPVDGDPNFLSNTGYPVRRLYERLGMLPAKQVLVAMDACFSGAGGRSLLASGARPLLTRIETGSVPRNVTALTASASNEISGSLDQEGHGAFTYFLLKGLDGAAKDASGRVTPKSLLDYARPRVQDEARRLNRDQTPQLLGGDAGMVLR